MISLWNSDMKDFNIMASCQTVYAIAYFLLTIVDWTNFGFIIRVVSGFILYLLIVTYEQLNI